MQLTLSADDLIEKHQRNPRRNNMTRKCPIRFLGVEKFKPEVIKAINLIGGALYVEGSNSKNIWPDNKKPGCPI